MPEDDTGQMGPIIDELLCFMMNKYSVLDRDTIVKLCSETFTEADTKTSKDLLFGILHDEADQTMFKNRRHTKANESKTVKNLGDIYQLLQEKGTNDLPKFVAHDLSKLPPITYENIDVSVLLTKMNNVHTDIEMLKDVLRSQCEVQQSTQQHNTMIQDRLFQLEKVVGASGTSIQKDDNQCDSFTLNNTSQFWERAFKCQVCEFRFNTEEDLEVHMTNHKGDNTFDDEFECMKCDFKCDGKDDFDEHMLYHKNDNVFRCPICIYQSESQSDLEKHLPMHKEYNEKGSELYKCNECDFKCDTEIDLGTHALVHLNDNMYICPLCAYKCHTKEDMENHLRNHIEKCGNVDKFSCKECNFKCNNENDLKKHTMTHKVNFIYSCPICVYECGSKDDMESHLKTHIGEKPSTLEIECNECVYKTNSTSDMERHKLTHKCDMVYVCPECVYQCTSKGDIQKHMQTHRGEKPILDLKSCSESVQNTNVWDQLSLDQVARKHFIDTFYYADGFSGPTKSGKSVKSKDLQHKNVSNAGARGSILSSNSTVGTSSSAARTHLQGKRQANLFATRYGPNVHFSTIKKELEINLRRVTGQHHEVNVEKLETKYDSYSSFKITCLCENPDVFKNADLWPSGILVRWWRKPRNDNILVGRTQ